MDHKNLFLCSSQDMSQVKFQDFWFICYDRVLLRCWWVCTDYLVRHQKISDVVQRFWEPRRLSELANNNITSVVSLNVLGLVFMKRVFGCWGIGVALVILMVKQGVSTVVPCVAILNTKRCRQGRKPQKPFGSIWQTFRVIIENKNSSITLHLRW